METTSKQVKKDVVVSDCDDYEWNIVPLEYAMMVLEMFKEYLFLCFIWFSVVIVIVV